MRLLVGLTGGIGSGKSEVGKIFADLGAFLIDADMLAREAAAPGSEGVRRIAARWPRVVGPEEALDRKALGDIIFENPRERAVLNEILHPFVRTLMRARCQEAEPDRIVVYEAALLFEAGVHREIDLTILIVAPLEERIARLMKRNGWDREQVVCRMKSQMLPEEAGKIATHTLRNDGSLMDLRVKAERLYKAL